VDTDLKDKHIVITGASGGIGIAIVKQFLSEGGLVSAAYNTSRRELSRLEQDWSGSIITIKADVRDEKQVENVFREGEESYGRVDVLVANAGIANPLAHVQEMSLKQWENTISVNLTGTFLCAKYFFQSLQKFPDEHGNLILIGSTAGLIGEAGFCDYSASKAGMHGLLMSLKNEIVHLAPKGRVNLVNPGWTLTPMVEGLEDDHEKVKRILQTMPIRKLARPEDIASTVLYLASDRLSGHVSGQTITVAGGMEGRVLFELDGSASE
jgi:NAD(P)-dependent dehydrogenase (short-subunit alcohol dehydrogenase family)